MPRYSVHPTCPLTTPCHITKPCEDCAAEIVESIDAYLVDRALDLPDSAWNALVAHHFAGRRA